MTNDRVFLIGPRGSGKTTAGRLLAGRLGWAFVDADEELEARAGRSIAAIFAADGEPAFRELESAVLHDLATRARHVIACGGGVVLRDEHRQLLRTTGHCVWLTGGPATLTDRLAADPTTAVRRPSLTDLPTRAEIESLLREREPLYREVAHCVVATDGRSPDEVVSAILSTWPTPSSSTCP
jgi:shikimate kinase